jgi:NAD(P)-dependent dehydrogenase (short-subunit alcohol dehydrogenase family)
MRVLVTGASRGIGRATCLKLARQAAAEKNATMQIAACGSRHGDELDTLIAELGDLGVKAVGLLGDLAEPAVPARLVAEAAEALGGLDAVVSNAGITRASSLAELPLEEWDHLFAVNTRASWLLAKAAYPWLKASQGGFVTVASVAGVMPQTGLGAYSPTKAALIMLTRLLAQEWADDGIRVNCVSPGLIHTPMTARMYANAGIKAGREALIPLHKIGAAEADIAGAIAFFLGPDAPYCTGQNLVADGGLIDSIMAQVPGRVGGGSPRNP